MIYNTVKMSYYSDDVDRLVIDCEIDVPENDAPDMDEEDDAPVPECAGGSYAATRPMAHYSMLGAAMDYTNIRPPGIKMNFYRDVFRELAVEEKIKEREGILKEWRKMKLLKKQKHEPAAPPKRPLTSQPSDTHPANKRRRVEYEDGAKVFIKGLAPDTTHRDVVKHFSQFGGILKTFVSPEGNKAFVIFRERAVADKVLSESHTLCGSQVSVERAPPERIPEPMPAPAFPTPKPPTPTPTQPIPSIPKFGPLYQQFTQLHQQFTHPVYPSTSQYIHPPISFH